MISRSEILALARDAFKDAAALDAARSQLQQRMIERGGDGTLFDIQCHLAEDRQTVLIYSDYGSDTSPMVSFRLQKPVAGEEDFDSEFYVMQLENAPVDLNGDG